MIMKTRLGGWAGGGAEGAAGAGYGGGGLGRSEGGWGGGDRGVGGGRGDDGGGAGRGGRGRGGDRGGRLPSDRVVQRGQHAGAADPVPGRGRRDGGGPAVGGVRRGPVRGRVHGGQRRDVLADPGAGAGTLVGSGGSGPARAGDGSLVRQGRGAALGRVAGPGDDRAGLGADARRRRGQGLGRGPEPPRPAALRGHEQLPQRLPDRRQAFDAGDQRAARAGAGRPAVRRLPGGPGDPYRAYGHRADWALRPAWRASGPAADRPGRRGGRGGRGDPDARAAGPVRAASRAAGP